MWLAVVTLFGFSLFTFTIIVSKMKRIKGANNKVSKDLLLKYSDLLKEKDE
jgi:hypothetical protein